MHSYEHSKHSYNSAVVTASPSYIRPSIEWCHFCVLFLYFITEWKLNQYICGDLFTAVFFLTTVYHYSLIHMARIWQGYNCKSKLSCFTGHRVYLGLCYDSTEDHWHWCITTDSRSEKCFWNCCLWPWSLSHELENVTGVTCHFVRSHLAIEYRHLSVRPSVRLSNACTLTKRNNRM